MIDWRAVEFAVNGTRNLNLTPIERRMVIRRLSHRLIKAGDNTINPAPGTITHSMLAEQLGCTMRCVQHILQRLPPADRYECGVCGSQMWVTSDGVAEPHPDSICQQCPLSDYELPTVTAEDVMALKAVWLARWAREDMHGVQTYLSRLGRRDRDALLASALAMISVHTDPERLLAWVAS